MIQTIKKIVQMMQSKKVHRDKHSFTIRDPVFFFVQFTVLFVAVLVAGHQQKCSDKIEDMKNDLYKTTESFKAVNKANKEE